MAEAKRYFWLKLHDDFFSSIRIKKLRKMAGGDTYVIIYLKMQLKAIKTDGCLTWKGYEQDFVDELSLDIDEEPDNVRVTLAYLLSCGLAETDGNANFFLPYAIENTGSESSAAERMRKMRERNNVTPMLHERYGEKEKDIEKDIEKEEKKKKPPKADAFAELAGDDADLLQALRDFNEMRTRIKHPLSDRAKAMLVSKLQTFPRDQWIAILDQSIFHSWQGIFPLDKKTPQPSGKTADALHASYQMMEEWANDQN